MENEVKTFATPSPLPVSFLSASLSSHAQVNVARAAEGENYAMFDVNLEEVEVSLSLMRWLDGKGLVKDAKLKGVRGVIGECILDLVPREAELAADRRSVWWDQSKPLVPSQFRHATRSGDFELEYLHIEDALVTVYQPDGQRPFNFSVFNAAIGPLRKRWLFYDILSAEAITGQLDNCLYSLHMPQKPGRAQDQEEGAVKRMAGLDGYLSR